MRTSIPCVALLVLVTAACSVAIGVEVNEKGTEFGKPIRQIVYDDLPTAECLIDFDKGKVSKPSTEPLRSNEDAIKYFKKSGFDASGEGDHLVGVEMIAKRVPNSFWDSPRPRDIDKQLAKEKPRTPLRIRHEGKFPCTFVIKTLQGGKGVMRFTRLIPAKDGNPVGLEVEYKLLRSAKQGVAKKKG